MQVLFRRLGILAIILFTIQVAITLGLRVNLPRQSLSGYAVVYASPVSLPGASAAARVVVLDVYNGRVRRDHQVVVRTEPDFGPLQIQQASDGSLEIHTPPTPEGGFEWVVAVQDPSGREREIRTAQVVPTTGTRLSDARWRRGGGTPRPVLPNVFPQEHPGIYPGAAPVAEAEEAAEPIAEEGTEPGECSLRAWITLQGGVLAAGHEQSLSILVVNGEGAPVPGLSIRLEGQEGQVVGREFTSSLGVAELRTRVQGPTDWSLVMPCAGGGEQRQAFRVVPTMDGITLDLASLYLEPGGSMTLVVDHQRAWGDWYRDVWCNGAWLFSASEAVRNGPGAVSMRGLVLPAGDVATLCVVQGSPYLWASDPPHALRNFVLGSPGQSLRETLVQELPALVAQEPELAALLGEGWEQALARALDHELQSLFRWLMDGLGPNLQTPALLLNDRESALADFAAEQGERARALSRLLLLDGLMLSLGVALALFWGWRSSSAQIELDGEEQSMVSGARLIIPVVVLVVMALSLGGVAFLLRVLR